ncbi:MAG: PilZ domain-containing protein, partial [Treponema sp.]|nr:PilZ domain-containing protein [Treponema sp.]
MKLLMVLGSDESHELISLYVRPLGFELIRYHHVLKAMDNVDEVDPSAIIISARDFPRHWKILVQFVRSQRSKEKCPIIILKGENFLLEETSQAFFLGVSGIITEALEDPEEIDRLQGILSRYIPVEEKRKFHRIHVNTGDRFELLIFNPLNGAIVPGKIKTISITGISFYPDSSSTMENITLNMELAENSLRVGDAILSPVCKLVRTGRIISLEFVSFPENEREILEKYLEELPLKKLGKAP